jgi:hypothetical protein
MSKFYGAVSVELGGVVPEATVMIDLKEDKNVAGITGWLTYKCGFYRIDQSKDNVTWTKAFEMGNNNDNLIKIQNNNHHFKARYLRIYMKRPKIKIDHPDNPGDKTLQGYVFGITNFSVWEHTGGGGAVGIQNLDGTEFSTIVWGQRQPGEWMLGSEGDIFTQDLGGGAYKLDEGNAVHIVVTFRKVIAQDEDMRRIEIKFYRNGLAYGTAYQKETHKTRLSLPNQTRLILGVRSSIFANETLDTPLSTVENLAGIHGMTHSPYFWGKVYNVTLLQNALSPEEVAGLYHVTRGGEELGCHCYDACPFGYNRFDRSVPVPCSGQGVCLRHHAGIPLAPGHCDCLPGYSGDNCQVHCSELSVWGCCEIDDDCPVAHVCNRGTKACSNDTSIVQPVGDPGFSYY